jgi:phosphoglycerol transferase MdoB-like AlkP superfamily enzyme
MLILAYGVGLLGGAMRHVSKLMRGQRPTSQVSVMVAILTVLAVLVVSLCAYRWKRQYAGLGKGRTTFLVSLAIVIAYNVILVVWLWRTIPQAVSA